MSIDRGKDSRMWYIYTMEYYSTIKNDERMPLEATWINLEIIILTDVRQTKRNVMYHLHMESEKKKIQMNLFAKRNRSTDLENKLKVTERERGWGIN